jgi:protein phosphatase
MLICPYCQSVNPQHHNFCQSCGRSLKHYLCHSCSSEVDFDAESCPQCQAVSGTYWWAIIAPTAGEQTTDVNIASAVTVAGATQLNSSLLDDDSEQKSQISTALNLSAKDLQMTIDLNPWDLPGTILIAPIATGSENLSAVAEPLSPKIAASSNELEVSPWDLSQPLPPNPDQIGENKFVAIDDPTNSQPLVATTYLDASSRYRLLDPVVIQLLAPNDSSQVRVIDRQPFCNTLLEILMEQEPVTLDSTTAADVNSIASSETVPTQSGSNGESIEPSRQWQFWNSHGIPKIAQAYIALQVSLPGTVPAIRDSWNHDAKTVTIVEDRSEWTLLADRWNDPQIPSSQVIYWLDYTLKLWVALEPWQMRQSLLEIANLLLDEDARICFQRLYPEPADRKLRIADLAQMWKQLFDRFSGGEATSTLNIDSNESDRPHSSSLANLLQAIQHGEVERVEEVRSRLQQIAYELEPKQLSAPLQSATSGDLSSPHDAPTIALDQKLLDLEEAAGTHTGKKRDHNEDCFGIVSRIERQDSPKGKNISAQGLYILCDGMGGHAGGEIASAMTVDLLRDYFSTRWGDTLPDEQTIREGIVAANEAVFEINQKNSSHGSGRMGTTLVLVLVQDRDIAVAHVGDSRCYGITPTQGLIQLTLDHEVGQQQILRGVDPDIAYGRPDSYQLTQAIGPRDRNYIAPDIRFFELQEDTLILLASDGLTDNQLLENYWLTNVAPLLSSNSNLQQGVDRLIDFANEYNGHDNITALVVRAKLG